MIIIYILLSKGRTYRWSLYSVDSSGKKTYDLLKTLNATDKRDIELDNVYLVMNQGGSAIRGNISTTDKEWRLDL